MCLRTMMGAVFLHFQAWPKGGGEPREGHIADLYTVQEGKVVQMQGTPILLRLANPLDLLTNNARERKWAPSLETERARNQKYAVQTLSALQCCLASLAGQKEA